MPPAPAGRLRLPSSVTEPAGTRTACSAHGEQETGDFAVMERRFIATGKRRSDVLALGRCVPVGGGGDGAMVRGEADQDGVAAVPLAHELADVQLAAPAHVRRARVTEVRVMRPDDDLRAPRL